MAGCAVGVLLTGLPRISPEIQGKKQGKNCPGTGTCLWQCTGPQFPAGLLFLCGTGLRSAGRAGQGRAVHGVVPGLACGGVTGRTGPAHVNPVISHRHPDICPDETRGRAIPPARAGAGPRPGPHVRPGSCQQQYTRGAAHPGDREAGCRARDPCPSPAPSAHGPAPAITVLPPANRTGPVKPDTLIDTAICRT